MRPAVMKRLPIPVIEYLTKNEHKSVNISHLNFKYLSEESRSFLTMCMQIHFAFSFFFSFLTNIVYRLSHRCVLFQFTDNCIEYINSEFVVPHNIRQFVHVRFRNEGSSMVR
jgi:hypothetical protein